jgi:hypothetical protein
MSRIHILCLALGAVVACSSDDTAPLTGADAGLDAVTTNDSGIPIPDGSLPQDASVASKARAFTDKLIGVGNDGTNDGNDDAYKLGVTLDLHYHYLVGLSSEGGWPTWNANPDYAGKRVNEAKAHDQVPMLTLYAMAAHGDRNLSVLTDAAYMTTYFKDFLQLVASVKAAGGSVLIQDEPDFWGYMLQETTKNGGDPTKLKALVSKSGAAECAGEPDDIVGLAHCKLKIYRTRAPNALVGFHASVWGTNVDTGKNQNPQLDVVAEANKAVTFFQKLGMDLADYVATDVSDRDAGCYEVGHEPMCHCVKGNGYNCDNFYWDEANTALPNFKQHFKWAKALTDGIKLPLIWWQIPYGSPSNTPGGQVGAYRDNRVHNFFAHIGELVAAGGVGAVWGTGAGDQSYSTPEFKAAVTKYFAAPYALP